MSAAVMPGAGAWRVLVTGGSGFIGTNLVEAFVGAGHEVCSLDRAPPQNSAHARFYQAVDLTDAAALTRAIAGFAPTHVVHMGARTDLVADPFGTAYAVNTEGTRNLIEAMRAAGSVRRCLFTSTKLVVRNGATPSGPCDFQPDTAYGASKVEMEKLIRATAMPWEWCIVRPTSIWGPWFGVPYRGFVLTVAKGRYVQLGTSDPPRAFGYVGNIVQQVVSLLHAPAEAIQEKVFYLTDYDRYRIGEWADVIVRQLGRSRPRVLPEPLVQLAARGGDLLKALGWKNVPMTSFRLRNMRMDTSQVPPDGLEALTGPATYSLEQGVKETIAWLRARRLL